MAKEKGYYSKASRHARKSAACAKCQAEASRILEPRVRKARGPRQKKVYSTKKIMRYDANDQLLPQRKKYPRPAFIGPRNKKAVKRTITDEQIMAAARNMAARMIERRLMGANSMAAT